MGTCFSGKTNVMARSKAATISQRRTCGTLVVAKTSNKDEKKSNGVREKSRKTGRCHN